MSYVADYSQSSVESLPSTVVINPVPLPPRRRRGHGGERPPRPVRPKPAKYLSLDSLSTATSVKPKLSMEITPIPEVERLDTCEVKVDKEAEDKSDPDDVVYGNLVADKSEGEVEAAKSAYNSQVDNVGAIEVIVTIEAIPSKSSPELISNSDLKTIKSDGNDGKIPVIAQVIETEAVSECKTLNNNETKQATISIEETELQAQSDEDLGSGQVAPTEGTVSDIKDTLNENSNGSSSSTDTSADTIIEVNTLTQAQIGSSTKSLDSSDSLFLSDPDDQDGEITVDEDNSVSTMKRDTDDDVTVVQYSPNSSRSCDTLKKKSDNSVIDSSDSSNTLQRNGKKGADLTDSSLSSNSYSAVSKCSRLFGNPKIVKDLKNKISKTETQGSKTFAAEITDFFKTSASKLKPPCLDQLRRNASKKMERDVSEPNFRTTQRLIPRSAYIGPFSYSPKRPVTVKQPPFYAWNLNSKNAAVSSNKIPSSASCSGIKSVARDLCDDKTLKNIENATRKILYQVKGAKGVNTEGSLTDAISDPIAVSSKHCRSVRVTNSAPGIHSTSKPRLVIPRKVTTDPQNGQSSSRPRKPSPTTSLAQNLRDLKNASKNLSKINIHLPTPQITVAKVKTQLPCEFPKPRKSRVRKVPNEKVEKSLNELPIEKYARVVSQSRKWVSMLHGLFISYPDSGVPMCCKQKRHTWPPRSHKISNG